jgi:hypothetical protein
MWRKTMLTRNLPEPPDFFFFEKWRRTRFIEHAVNDSGVVDNVYNRMDPSRG